MDSPTRRHNVNQINSFLNSNDVPKPNGNINTNTNLGVNNQGNINVGQNGFNPNYDNGHRVDQNKSVFEGRRDPILIEHGPSHVNNNSNGGLNPTHHNDYNQGSFGVNANFNNGNMAFSNVNTLGSNINRQSNDKHYFEGAQMSKIEDFISSRRL